MSIHTNTFSGKERLPLTRSDVEERLKRVKKGEQLHLVRADLRGSDLSHLRLRGANLSFANLSGADLSGANLSNTSLLGANLHHAHLNEANLDNANLRGTHFNFADLSGVDLTFVDLSFDNLTGANLSGANLSGADLSGADLSGADLSGANLSGANLSGADVSGANLRRADLSDTNLLNAELKGADIMSAHFFQTQITFGPELLLQSLGIALLPPGTNDQNREQKEMRGGQEAIPTLRLRIQEEPLTLQHLSATLDALTSLSVKTWLLQHHRFDDFIRYTEQKDRLLEEEVNVHIAELKYNSPADIKLTFDFSPKAFIEALLLLFDAITQTQLRIQAKRAENHSHQLDNLLKEAQVQNARLDTADHLVKTVEQTSKVIDALWPGLEAEQKVMVLQSMMKDVSSLAGDQTLEISLLLSPPSQQQNGHSVRQEQEGSVHTSEKAALEQQQQPAANEEKAAS